MISHDTVAMTLVNIRVFRRPIFSERYPANRLPIGQAIAVIDANHEISDAFRIISSSPCDKSCVVIAGYPNPIPNDVDDKLARSVTVT